MSGFAKLLTVGAFASTALAHGTVKGLTIDGQYVGGFLLDYYYMKQNGQTPPETPGWYAENLDNGFVEPNSYTKPDIICHKNAEPATSSAKVTAGGTVDFHWTEWPESHVGPMLTYVAKCDGDCSSVDKSTLKFVKIDEAGYDGDWASNKMIANNNTWSVTVPSNLAAGNYVFRHETIALHGAGSENGAQNYPQCLNIEVTGSGSESPEGVLGTALYTPTDAGILFNPYSGTIDYTIPGPALFGSGSGSGSGNNNTAPSTPSATPTQAPASSTVPSATASPTVADNVSTPTPSAGSGSGSDLPETFTIEQFISWLQTKAGSKSGAKLRRHPRAFNKF